MAAVGDDVTYQDIVDANQSRLIGEYTVNVNEYDSVGQCHLCFAPWSDTATHDRNVDGLVATEKVCRFECGTTITVTVVPGKDNRVVTKKAVQGENCLK